MKNIKGFFNKQVSDVKFKLAGSGRRLNDEPSEEKSSSNSEPGARVEPSQEAARAGQAALSRFTSCSSSQNVPVKKPTKKAGSVLIESNSKPSQDVDTKNKHKETKESLVYFQCPLIGPDVLTYEEWMVKIKQYLEEFISNDQNSPSYLAVLIKSVNEPEKANFACEKLKLCLENIINHPEEEKYKKIKANNTLFKDKLLPIYGTEQFLISCGFDYVTIDDVKFLIFQPDNSDLNVLETYIEALDAAEPIQLILDRNIKVINDKKGKFTEETEDFFKLTTEEVRLESARRHEEIEEMQILKTRAMREKSLNANSVVHEYAVIKIKFPDGVHLQGTFKVNETVQDIRNFVMENLRVRLESFNLLTSIGRNVLDSSKTLTDEKLVPSALVHFEWNEELSSGDQGFLKDEVLALTL